MVDRRVFLMGAGAAGMVSSQSMAQPALARSEKEWIIVSAFERSGLLGRALERFADFLKVASAGRLAVKTYHAGELVAPFKACEAVQNGVAQMGFGAPYYWADQSEAISFVAGMPFGLTAQEQNAWCYYGDGIKVADELAYNPLGLKFLPMGNTGNQMGGWYSKQIRTIDDLKDLKFRMPGIGGEILKTFGVMVINLPGSELLTALGTGRLDGTEWIGPAADLHKEIFKFVKNYYYPGWHEPATLLDGFIGLSEWEQLDSELKEIIAQGATSMNLSVLSHFQHANSNALQKLMQEHDVKVRRYSHSLVRQIGRRAAEVIPAIADRSPQSKRLFNHLIDYRRKMTEWSGYSEADFLVSRLAAKFALI
jgi:TRAP-type mannitol/chloroaromatic compound transport system substrate-binding protein